jgi:hypothetical protein
MAARKDLGTLLAEEKVISSADLDRARKLHREQGGRLLDHLLSLSAVTEGDVFALLGGRAGIAAIPEDRLGGVHVPLELRRAVPRALADEMRIVPIELSSDGRTLSVVASDPTDETALEAVRRAAGVDAVRAYLGKRAAVLQVIAREYPSEDAAALPSSKIELDPELAREIAQMAPEPVLDRERTPTVKLSPPPGGSPTTPKPERQPTPTPERQPTPAEVQVPLELVHRAASEAAARRVTQQSDEDDLTPTPAPADAEKTQVRRAPAGRVDEDARTPIPQVMRAADERQHQVLSQTIGLLVDLAETALAGTSHARELGRWARRVAREMGLAERAIAEIGLAAELYALDRTLREVGEDPPDFVGTFGWAAGAPDGLAPMLRVLVERTKHQRTPAAGGVPSGARIVLACDDVLKLRKESTGVEMERVTQLLQAHQTPIEVIEAIYRVLSADRAARATKAQNDKKRDT